jgi:hypothetical protein
MISAAIVGLGGWGQALVAVHGKLPVAGSLR